MFPVSSSWKNSALFGYVLSLWQFQQILDLTEEKYMQFRKTAHRDSGREKTSSCLLGRNSAFQTLKIAAFCSIATRFQKKYISLFSSTNLPHIFALSPAWILHRSALCIHKSKISLGTNNHLYPGWPTGMFRHMSAFLPSVQVSANCLGHPKPDDLGGLLQPWGFYDTKGDLKPQNWASPHLTPYADGEDLCFWASHHQFPLELQMNRLFGVWLRDMI